MERLSNSTIVNENNKDVQLLLTTVDNPFDPADDWDSWYGFDMDHGYNTCSLLAVFAKTSPSLSDEMNASEIEDAMLRIVELHPSLYKILSY